MPILKCKMCGGDIEVSSDKTFGTCEYCGCTMTLPKVEDDQRAAMFNRGNHFRRIGEYDKALAVYERIVAEDNADAEAHWCCALSRFGIEYVEDPSTYEWLPTCHRLSLDSFLEDVDYQAALEYSDGITRRQYQKDAMKIAEVQKGILSVSQKEEPFDVFICYKESGENNERTKDSILAQDIYYQLTDKGYKVFFSRITLEEKAGMEYEPYIFAALNSAKVMVVVGTKPEYLNAVWVKNEWSRYLQLMKKDRSRIIIPCYKDMDPYDLPEQLSVLQSYDMTKIGFVQDLLRGIEKIIIKEEDKPQPATTVIQSAGPNITALLTRGSMALEDRNWDTARKYYDDVLNMDAKCADAYLGLAMADLKASTRKDLAQFVLKSGIQNRNYDRAKQFASDELKEEMRQWESAHQQEIHRREEAEKERIYQQAWSIKRRAALNLSSSLSKESDLKSAAKLFGQITGYKDSSKQMTECSNMANAIIQEEKEKEQHKKETLYLQADEADKNSKNSDMLRNAADQFKQLIGFKDAEARMNQCLQKAKEIDKEEEQRLFKEIEKAKNDINSELANINDQIQNKEKELSKLGLFKNREKAEIKNQIELLNKKCEDLKCNEALKTRVKPILLHYLSKKGLDYNTKTKETIRFGKWPSNSDEQMEWIVLAKQNGEMLLITKEAIERKTYHIKKEDITWEKCSLRKWLNEDFYENAFNPAEKTVIQTTDIKAEKNPKYTTNPGNNTKDKVSLLSIGEAKMYFRTETERRVKASLYALEQGVLENNRSSWWWLRSPGGGSKSAAVVDYDGSVSEIGNYILDGRGAVRPVLWVKID